MILSTMVRAARISLWVLPLLAACRPPDSPKSSPFSIEFERYALANGLDVVLHLDRSDPVVAVAMTYHVGSSRERPDRTGLAHLFEHLLFLDSENLGPGGLDLLIDKVGGTLNGFTDRDRTTYFEVVPNDALEKILWAEADKLGFFINTVTDPVVEKEKQVVKNEKRENYDNQPYGHTYPVIWQHLYPEGHPYSWPVIGSLEDLDGTTLADVREFYSSWYTPNNATLVVAGDFDIDQTREWIERYFGEIPSRPLPDPLEATPAVLAQTKRLYHEDRLARVPELTLTWPTVPLYHPDAPALEMLAALLSDHKRAPLYSVIVDEDMLAPSVEMTPFVSELAGELTLTVRAFARTDLDDVYRAIREAFGRFEDQGVRVADLDRFKAGFEGDFYNGYRGVSSVLGQAFKLAEYTVLAGSPAYLSEDMRRLGDVAPDDVMRVYAAYIQNKPRIATSFVPAGQVELALEGSVSADVSEEMIGNSQTAELDRLTARDTPNTPSTIDRSTEPPFGAPPSIRLPEVWSATLPDGLRVFGIEDRELPVVRLAIRLDGGLLLDDPAKVGVGSMAASLMNEGTLDRTPEALEEAIAMLGSSVRVAGNRDSVTISVDALRRNFQPTMDLVQEILLEPRWDETEFQRAKQRTLATLERQAASPEAIADRAFNRLLYGNDHILAENPLGTIDSVESITIEDLKDYYQRNISPAVATLQVAGDVSQDEVIRSLSGLSEHWPSRSVAQKRATLPPPLEHSQVFFIDVPNATQSVIRIGSLALAETDPDFYPATILNLRLGGSFVSRLVQVLREQRGYTYNVFSTFGGGKIRAPFSIRTSVRTDATFESLRIILDILESYGKGFDRTDLEATRSFLTRANARSLETLNAKVGMLENIGALGFPSDYVLERQQILAEITLERLRALADQYLNPNRMIFLIAGDARTQLGGLTRLGLGKPIAIDRDGRPLSETDGQ